MKFQRGSPRSSSSRVGVARGLGSTTLSPLTQCYSLARVHRNRSGPRRVRGEAAPCIVSCPRDHRTSRHSCQRLPHESFHHAVFVLVTTRVIKQPSWMVVLSDSRLFLRNFQRLSLSKDDGGEVDVLSVPRCVYRSIRVELGSS